MQRWSRASRGCCAERARPGVNLALFDFDGTITARDSFPGFLRYAVSPRRQRIGVVVLAPWILGYRAGLVPAPAVRGALARFGFRGEPAASVRELGLCYARDVIPRLVRPCARERIAWHQERGDRVVVVSASLDVYLAGWCESLGIERISTELEIVDGAITGRFAGGDCSGPEKARRVRAAHDLASYARIYAYGDTHEDLEMLALAHERYFRWRAVNA